MSCEQMRELCQKVVLKAMDKRVDQCDVIMQSGKSFSTSVQKGKLDKYQVSSSTITGLRIIKDHRVGIAYSEAQDESSIDRMVQQALDNSRFSDTDEYQSIDQVNKDKKLIVQDKQLCPTDSLTAKDKVNLCVDIEGQVLRSDNRVASVPYNGVSDSAYEHAYSNHLGTFAYQTERMVSCYVAALTKDRDQQAMYAYSDVARSFDDLDSKKCVNGALAYALPLLQAHPVKTGRYDVVFEIDQLSQLISSFISVFSAKQVLEGRSGFKGRLGEQVASSLLTIIDDPVYKDGFGYTTFDSEGSSRQSLTLIENGRLTSFLHNTSTAKQFGAPNTAHAARGARGPLGVSSTQIRILEGQQSEADLYAGRFLKIVGLKGIHSGTDAVSGHFSLAAEGCLYENGTIAQYVKGITISGNFFDLLSRAVAVENKVQVSSSKSFFAPSIRFEGLSIAGA